MDATDYPSLFSASYADSREKFLRLTEDARWRKAIPYPLPTKVNGEESQPGPDTSNVITDPLAIDVAYFGQENPERTVLVTSGLHGVEGFFGAAVQCGFLEKYRPTMESLSSTGLLMIHALNPFGFALRRRWNEQNVDLNRNFLLPDQTYSGAPPHYAQLQTLLNPPHAPRMIDGFYAQALWAISRYGFNALQQAIAGGQYEYPAGLFFGGSEPSTTLSLLQEHLPRWVDDCPEVIHLDFHTGLGKWGTHQLLIEESLESEPGRWLQSAYGADHVRSPHNTKSAYLTRGGLGSWCKHLLSDRKYVYACAEFGTYNPLKILIGLRAENQAYWYSGIDSPQREAAAKHLVELFCPASESWRRQVVKAGMNLVLRPMLPRQQPSSNDDSAD